MEKEPVPVSPIYSCLREKNLLIIETEFTAHRITEEAKSMQKMNVYSFQSRPILRDMEVSLNTFMEQKRINFLIIQPYPACISEIREVIKNREPVILIRNPHYDNKEMNDALTLWQQQGIQIVEKDNMRELPRILAKRMADMTKV